MATSPTIHPSSAGRVPLRIRLRESSTSDGLDGAWWPQSRSLQVEAADLIDHLPDLTGYVNRLLFSRPDWDDALVDGHGTRRIRARRGPVKVGSFPSDDTHLMVLVTAGGRRLRLRVIAPDTPAAEAHRQLDDLATEAAIDDATEAATDAAAEADGEGGAPADDRPRWDTETPSF